LLGVENNQNKGVWLAASAYEPESGGILGNFYGPTWNSVFILETFLDNTLPTKNKEGTYAQRKVFV